MDGKLPKPSYRSLEMQANKMADLRGFIYLAGGLTHTMRYRASGEPEKPIENFDLSIGDRDYLVSVIIEYYIFNNKNEFSDADRERLSELSISYDLGDVARTRRVEGAFKTRDEQSDELRLVIELIGNLPDGKNFRDKLWANFLIYKTGVHIPDSKLLSEQDRRFVHIVRAAKGLSQLMYIASKPKEIRKKILENQKLSIEILELKYGRFCNEFPLFKDWYKSLIKFLGNDLSSLSREIEPLQPYENPSDKAELLDGEPINTRRAFELLNFFSGRNGISNRIHVLAHAEPAKVSIRNEVYQLLKLMRLKRVNMFSEVKSSAEHRDSVSEHSSMMATLASYFLPIVLSDPEQSNKQNIVYKDVVSESLVHDLGEIVRGDKTPDKKTVQDSRNEEEDLEMLHRNYFPRQGGFNDYILQIGKKYEHDKSAEVPKVCPATFVKCLDVIEAFLYIIDPETTDKKEKMKLVDVDSFYEKNKKFFQLYPVLDRYFEEIVLLYKVGS